MKNVKNYTIIHKPLWHYIQRDDSIVSNYTIRNLDILKGLNERYIFINKYYPELKLDLLKLIFKTSILHYNIIKKLNKRKYSINLEEIRNSILQNYSEVYDSLDDNWLKAQLLLFKLFPNLNEVPLLINKILKKIGFLEKDLRLKRIDL